MNTLLTSLDLSPGRAVTLPRRPGLAICVTRGRVWLTRPGDPDDHFVDPGGRLVLGDADGPVVVEAVGGSARCRLEVATEEASDARALAA